MSLFICFCFTSSTGTGTTITNSIFSVPHNGMREGKSEPYVVFSSTEK